MFCSAEDTEREYVFTAERGEAGKEFKIIGFCQVAVDLTRLKFTISLEIIDICTETNKVA